MEHISTIARILGSFFYYPLTHETNQQVCQMIADDSDEQEGSLFAELLQAVEADGAEDLAMDFQQLFEGCEVMPAPPWGSVYLDREQVIFGETTVDYRHFLAEKAMSLDTGMREPEDQFGLMLMAMSKLAETNDNESIKVLLSVHLLPWAPRYLELMQKNAKTQSYQLLGAMAQQWLAFITEELAVSAVEKKVYF
ncbi:Tat proofreading chaperone DmsD [Photobacterium sp. DNB23_23_1]|uniref:Tat proofreading chaperone DmsD n=1 Tax=Photobacterium pectinilyticum TaxID=2906793 RepID=A0ABT1N772_9GAMM|nr:Tat proofreading chaperone DmsD [Photobacterium sp. ZSDE20]MCQ1060571.1 Tat proofreading chaperone DmsD [Photobacterium sp. ZSDE20]MDD1828089.1 Tat proofreading chaperone DmsD [Photobacterium sp. ZSDE20]